MCYKFTLSIKHILNGVFLYLLVVVNPVHAQFRDHEYIRGGNFELGLFDLDIIRFPRYAHANVKNPYRDSILPIDGNYSLRLPKVEKESGYRIIYKAYPLVSGEKYKLTFKARSIDDMSNLKIEVFQGWNSVKKKSIKVSNDEEYISISFIARDKPMIEENSVAHFFRIWVDGKSDLLIDNVSLKGPVSDAFMVQQPLINLVMDNVPAVYTIDSNANSEIIVTDIDCEKCSIKYTITDAIYNKEIINEKIVFDGHKKNNSFKLALETKKRGYYHLNATLFDGGGRLLQYKNEPYVVIDPKTSSLDARRPFGMAFEDHFRRTQSDAFVDVEDYYRIAKMIGIGTGRIFSLAMPDILSKDGVNFDFTQLDGALNFFEKYEIEPLIVLGANMPRTVPKWMRECAKERDVIDLLAGLSVKAHRVRFERTIRDGRYLCLSKYSVYLDKLLSHINGRVKYLEVWNEPGFKFKPDDYLTLLKLTRKSIDKAGSNFKLLGFSSTVRNDLGKGDNLDHSPSFLKDMVDRDAIDLVDILSYHSEHAFLFMNKKPNYKDQKTDFTSRIKKVLDNKNIPMKPIWDTERGVPWTSRDNRLDFMDGQNLWKYSRESESMLDVAKKIPMIYSEAFANNVKRLIWFNFESSIEVMQRSKSRKGFFDSVNEPGPQIPVYDAMSQMLSGAKFLKTLNNNNGDRGYIFENIDGLVMFVYNWKGNVMNRLSLSSIDDLDYKVFDVVGNIIESDDDINRIESIPKYWVLPKIKVDTIGFVGIE